MVIINVIKKKPYDLLDHRKMDFDTDYEEFCRQVGDLEVTWQCPRYRFTIVKLKPRAMIVKLETYS